VQRLHLEIGRGLVRSDGNPVPFHCLDVGLQFRPAREPQLACNDELSIGKLQRSAVRVGCKHIRSPIRGRASRIDTRQRLRVTRFRRTQQLFRALLLLLEIEPKRRRCSLHAIGHDEALKYITATSTCG
jgi:hypothetical protein